MTIRQNSNIYSTDRCKFKVKSMEVLRATFRIINFVAYPSDCWLTIQIRCCSGR